MITRFLTITGYLLVAGGIVAVELLARRASSRLLSFGELLSVVMSHPAGRGAALVLWWWVGWHFLGRGGADPSPI